MNLELLANTLLSPRLHLGVGGGLIAILLSSRNKASVSTSSALFVDLGSTELLDLRLLSSRSQLALQGGWEDEVHGVSATPGGSQEGTGGITFHGVSSARRAGRPPQAAAVGAAPKLLLRLLLVTCWVSVGWLDAFHDNGAFGLLH